MARPDNLGDLLKAQEREEAGRKADPFLPLMARIDGRSFSSFTKGLNRPFDKHFVNLMVETTRFLISETDALLGYCQSDEITLHWYLNKEEFSERELMFGGKFQKLTSVLASLASSFFSASLPIYIPEKVGKYPSFDARVWNVPDLHHVWLNYLWRWKDAQKNSVSMYARHFFSHRDLQGKTCNEMRESLRVLGEPWEKIPEVFREGTYLRREQILMNPSEENLRDIPAEYRPKVPVVRNAVRQIPREIAWDYLKT